MSERSTLGRGRGWERGGGQNKAVTSLWLRPNGVPTSGGRVLSLLPVPCYTCLVQCAVFHSSHNDCIEEFTTQNKPTCFVCFGVCVGGGGCMSVGVNL